MTEENGGTAMFNAAGLKMQRIDNLISKIHECRLAYHLLPEDMTDWYKKEARWKIDYMNQWISALKGFKMELYSKLKTEQKDDIDSWFKMLDDNLITRPLVKLRINVLKGNYLGVDIEREQTYLKILNKIESVLMIYFNSVGMDNPDKPEEGGYN